MILSIQQGLKDDGHNVSISTLCRWFDVPRRTVYYRSTKAAPKVRPELAGPIKQLIEQEPSFGYRTVAALLGMNKNTVQRIFQLWAGRSASGRWGSARESRHCLRLPWRPTSAGPPTCAASGAAWMAG